MAGGHSRKTPRSRPAMCSLRDLYMQERRYPEAAAQYTAAAKLTPDDGSAVPQAQPGRLGRGEHFGGTRRRPSGLPNYGPMIRTPSAFTAHWKASTTIALRPCRRCAAPTNLRPSDRDYLIGLVMMEMNMQDMAAAERDLTPWLAAHPDDAWAGHLMAVVDEQKPRTPATLQAAIALEERARAAMPGDMRVYITLGELYLGANRPADALRIYQTGLVSTGTPRRCCTVW